MQTSVWPPISISVSLVAEYVERQQVAETKTQRWSTALFRPEQSAPNGLVWIRLQETWWPTESQ